MTLLIEDYTLVGNNATAALVGNNGSIDWLCFRALIPQLASRRS
jgi:hypothetical protein